MPRFKLTIEYAGTRYSGWQIQKNARTVQGEIERAIHEATGLTEFELYGSGRTDGGVHALAQVAHLQIDTRLEPQTLVWRINDGLPADINVLAIEKVPHAFHARHDAVARRYLYQISRRRTAFAKPFVWWVREDLKLPVMQDAAALFVGMKDFRSFTADDPDETSTRVQIDRVEIEAREPLLLVRVQGSHFLWRMVRRLVGVLVAVGRRELRLADVEPMLTAASEIPAALTAPASGLFLERVFYPGDAMDDVGGEPEIPGRPGGPLAGKRRR
jgi:tRNA pseudouridine38-40 synthase